MRRMRWRRRRRLLLAIVALFAAGLGLLAHATGVFHRTELQTIDARFDVRGPQPQLLKNFVVVGIDSSTLSYFQTAAAIKHHYSTNWPFPRRDHARVIDNLVRAGARQIAVDIQFTQPTDETDDEDLPARSRMRATWCWPPRPSARTGRPRCSAATPACGRWADIRSPANASEIPDTDGVYRRMQFSFQGLEIIRRRDRALRRRAGRCRRRCSAGSRRRADRLCGPSWHRQVYISVLARLRGKFPASRCVARR